MVVGSLALAHEGHFSITDMQVIEKEATLSRACVLPTGRHDAPLSFSAALIDGEEAILRRDEGQLPSC
jgi:hypothetical protein